MKDLIGGAMRHVARVIEPMVGKLTEQSQTLSEPQLLHRYEKLHRGNPGSKKPTKRHGRNPTLVPA